MKRTMIVSALCLAGLAAAALAQQPSSAQSTSQQTTEVSSQGVTTTTVVQGKVVRYEPGKTIVLVGPDSRETTYTLAPKVEVPGDVRIGRQVSLSTEPSADGGQVVVTRITTQSMTPEGNLKTETRTQSTSPSGEQTTTKTTTVTGTVSAFQPGQSVTFVLPDKRTVVYTLDSSSIVPSDIAVGKTYTVETTRSTSGGPLVVRRITTTTTTKKTTDVKP